MRFQFIASYRGSLSCSRPCRLMGVTDGGLRAWRHRPPSQRPRCDMVILAPIRDQHRLSLGSHGRPRMTEELNEPGLRVGRRRVGRLMRQNGIGSSAAASSSASRTAITSSTSHRTSCSRTVRRAGRTRSGPAPSASCLDEGRLGPSGGHHRPVLKARHWLGHQQSPETGSGDQGAEHGDRVAPPATGLHSPHKPRLANTALTTPRRSCTVTGSKHR